MKSRLLLLTIAVSFLSLCLTIGMVAQANEWPTTLTAISNDVKKHLITNHRHCFQQ